MFAIRSRYKNEEGKFCYYEGTFKHTSKHKGARYWSAMLPKFTTSAMCALLFATMDEARIGLKKTCAPVYYKIIEIDNTNN